jgi:putative transposase
MPSCPVTHARSLERDVGIDPQCERRELVRWMSSRGLSERRCLGVIGMSASALRYSVHSRPQHYECSAQRVDFARARYTLGLILIARRN